MKLTERQKRFVDEYVITGNASMAARNAGYSEKTAFRTGQENMQKPAIKAAIDAKLKEIESHKTATAQEVIEFLTSVMRGEITEKVVTTESVAVGVSRVTLVDKPPTINDRTKAADQLLKRFGKPIKLEEKEMQLRIEKLKAEAEALKAVKESGGIQSVGMLQLVDSLSRAYKSREEREE
jgi:phage terminase small subunit